jgi:hypothetical protein
MRCELPSWKEEDLRPAEFDCSLLIIHCSKRGDKSMTNQNSIPEYVTREILKEEISASEKRLTTKIGGEISGVEKRLTAKISEEISGVEERLTAKIGEEISGVEKRLTAKIGEEISGVEKRLDVRIGTTAQSFKDYTDSRLKKTDATIKDLGTKMTKYFELMMQTLTDGNKGINKILSSHEERITVLEGRGPQPSRI